MSLTTARAGHGRWVVAAIVGAALVGATSRLPAQTAPKLPESPPLPPVQAAPEPPPSTAPIYEPKLERLSEVMGILTYLRDLCGKNDGFEWRNRMNALLEAEAGAPERRERLAGFFNRGFVGYQVSYRTCTPAAELVIARALDEGDRLARELSTRFGGS